MRWFWKFLLALKNGADDFCHHHIYSCRCPHCIFPMSPIPPDHFITGLRSYKAGLLFGIIIITFIHVIVPTVPIMEGVVTGFYVDPIGNVASWSAGKPTKNQCRVTRDQKPICRVTSKQMRFRKGKWWSVQKISGEPENVRWQTNKWDRSLV